MRPRRGLRFFWISVLAVSAFDLWLVWPDEIVARANPYDQERFGEMALALTEGRWLGPWNVRALARDPGYPLWIAAVHATGLPLRLASELLLLLAAPLFCLSLARAGAGAGLLAALHALLVLQPHGLVTHRELLPAGFYGVVLLLALAGLFFAARAETTRSRIVHGAWAGLCLGALAATRPERPLLLVAPAGIALWEAAALLRAGAGPRSAFLRAALLLLPPALAAVAVVLPISLANARAYGVFALTGVTSPSYLGANRVLTSIEQDAPRRFVPVPRDARERAYAVSPAFRVLRSRLVGSSWARGASCRIDRVCDDVAAGYFRWLLRESVAEVSGARSHAELEAYFARIEAEVGAACDDGRIACRAGLVPFLQPDTGTWLPHLPASLRRIAARQALPGDWSQWDPSADHPSTPPEVRRLFDRVANRRRVRTFDGRLSLAGSASAASGGPVSDVALLVRGHATGFGPGRPVPPRELSRERAPDGGEEVRFRFELPKTAPLARYMAPTLRVERASGEAPLFRVESEGRFERDGVSVEVEAFGETGRDDTARRRARSALWIGHTLVFAGLTLSALVALPVLALRRAPGSKRGLDPLTGAALVIAAVALSRLLVLAAIDASSFPARSSRYVYPVASLTLVAALLFARQAVARLRARESAADG